MEDSSCQLRDGKYSRTLLGRKTAPGMNGYTIAPLGFSRIQRRIGRNNSVAGGGDRGIEERRRSQTPPDSHRLVIESECVALDLRADSFGKGLVLAKIRIGQNDDELLAAVARDTVDVTKGVTHECGDTFEYVVASDMAEQIIHRLEVVHVQQEKARWGSIAKTGFQFTA